MTPPAGHCGWHFGVLSYKGQGHLNPMLALSRRLAARGHKITFVQRPELRERIVQQGFQFRPIALRVAGDESVAAGEVASRSARSVQGLRLQIERIAAEMELFLREAPAALMDARADVLLMDEIALAGPTVAETLGLPYFVVSTSLPHIFGWPATEPEGAFERVRDELLQVTVLRMGGPVGRRLDRRRREMGLGPVGDMFPELAHVTQLPRCLDFQREQLPSRFHYAGPFVDEKARSAVAFPWATLDGRRMVYASLGTTGRREKHVFASVAEACKRIDVQLVISLGGRGETNSLENLAGEPVVVKDAPQLELLKVARAVVCHAGLNTALEALSEGKPMVVVPGRFDQPAVAERLVWHGVAERVLPRDASPASIEAALRKLLHDDRYPAAARAMQAAIGEVDGLQLATHVIERSLSEACNHPRHAPRFTGDLVTSQ